MFIRQGKGRSSYRLTHLGHLNISQRNLKNHRNHAHNFYNNGPLGTDVTPTLRWIAIDLDLAADAATSVSHKAQDSSAYTSSRSKEEESSIRAYDLTAPRDLLKGAP